MCDPAPNPAIQPIGNSEKVFYIGAGLTFALSIGCMVANFFKPGSVPSEPIWAFGSVILGHKVSCDWKAVNQ